ncbi:MAG: sulfite exporter TauE/SafE family protein [Alphaproteobacteria bacterium]|nr:sulfite exporter TauE/SafE family protein [Alphaproteobacteria bacterium]
MQIYLPIAEMSVNLFLLLGLGSTVGFLSGMFGVGGGFLMTPLLIFSGIPPTVAVASQANQLVASSISGVIAHRGQRRIDVPLSLALTVGGILGAAIGLWIFNEFSKRGQIDIIISLCYVTFLGTIGSLMLIESLSEILQSKNKEAQRLKRKKIPLWVQVLPLKMHFKNAQLRISVIPIIGLGAGIGVLTAIMGVGGGFILIPAMIYLLHIPTHIVIGTSLLQILIVAAFVTYTHAITNQSVDILLAFILMIGSVSGAQIGARVGNRLRSEHLRSLLAFLVLITAARLAFDLIATPSEYFSLNIERN